MFELLEHCDGERERASQASRVRPACRRPGAMLLPTRAALVRPLRGAFSRASRRCNGCARAALRPWAAVREECASPRATARNGLTPAACPARRCLRGQLGAKGEARHGIHHPAPHPGVYIFGCLSAACGVRCQMRWSPWLCVLACPASAPCPCFADGAAPCLLRRALTGGAGPQAAHLLKGMVKGINKDGAAISQTKEAAHLQAMADDAMI